MKMDEVVMDDEVQVELKIEKNSNARNNLATFAAAVMLKEKRKTKNYHFATKCWMKTVPTFEFRNITQ